MRLHSTLVAVLFVFHVTSAETLPRRSRLLQEGVACTLPTTQGGYISVQGSLEHCTSEDCTQPLLTDVYCAEGFEGTPQVLGGCEERRPEDEQWRDRTMVILTGCVRVVPNPPEPEGTECFIYFDDSQSGSCEVFQGDRAAHTWFNGEYEGQTCEERGQWWMAQAWSRCFKDSGLQIDVTMYSEHAYVIVPFYPERDVTAFIPTPDPTKTPWEESTPLPEEDPCVEYNAGTNGNWCVCDSGFQMNKNPDNGHFYGNWERQFHKNAIGTEGFYCVRVTTTTTTDATTFIPTPDPTKTPWEESTPTPEDECQFVERELGCPSVEKSWNSGRYRTAEPCFEDCANNEDCKAIEMHYNYDPNPSRGQYNCLMYTEECNLPQNVEKGPCDRQRCIYYEKVCPSSTTATACTLPTTQVGYISAQGSLEHCTSADCTQPLLTHVYCAEGFVGTPQVLGGCEERRPEDEQWRDRTMVILTGCTEVVDEDVTTFLPTQETTPTPEDPCVEYNAEMDGSWCVCDSGFQMNRNPENGHFYGNWERQFHKNAIGTEGFYCVRVTTTPEPIGCGEVNENGCCANMITHFEFVDTPDVGLPIVQLTAEPENACPLGTFLVDYYYYHLPLSVEGAKLDIMCQCETLPGPNTLVAKQSTNKWQEEGDHESEPHENWMWRDSANNALNSDPNKESETAHEKNPWWQVDLRSIQKVKSITIYGSQWDRCGTGLLSNPWSCIFGFDSATDDGTYPDEGFIVGVSMFPACFEDDCLRESVICEHVIKSQGRADNKFVVDCPIGTRAQYVFIMLPTKPDRPRTLRLSHVEVDFQPKTVERDFFTLTGPCDFRDDCVSSLGYPTAHSNPEQCRITMKEDAFIIRSSEFSIGDTETTHFSVADKPIENVNDVPEQILAGETIVWGTTVDVMYTGWEFCFTSSPPTMEPTVATMEPTVEPSEHPTRAPTMATLEPTRATKEPTPEPTPWPTRATREPTPRSMYVTPEPTATTAEPTNWRYAPQTCTYRRTYKTDCAWNTDRCRHGAVNLGRSTAGCGWWGWFGYSQRTCRIDESWTCLQSERCGTSRGQCHRTIASW